MTATTQEDSTSRSPVPDPRTPPARIELYDTTLRDGTQAEGFNLSLVDKLKIARVLDDLGVDYVEGGYPLSNPKDAAFFEEARKQAFRHAKLCAFGMTRRKGVTAEEDTGMRALVAAGTPVITIVGKTWDLHVDEVLRVSREENLAMIRESVAYCGRGQAPLVPSMVPGSIVEIDGMGNLFNGNYRVAEVEHSFQPGHAFVTRFGVGAPEPTSLVELLGHGARPSSDHFRDGVTIGIVTNLEDPEAKMRVKLKLPYLADNEDTGWARVMQFGAGAGRGWWVHPEVGDEVIVAFENGDPRLPVVMGGVWSSSNAWPELAKVDGGVLSSRSYTSAKGHVLNFDDGDEPAIELTHAATSAHVRFDNSEGILIEAPDQDLVIKNSQGSITIAKNGDITIDGANITLKAQQKVKIEGGTDASVEATNVKLTAKTALEAKGATTKLEGSAMTEVKGAMVKIN